VLLIGAALLLASFRHLLAVDAGFTADRVTTATIFPPPSRYSDARAVDALVNRVLAAVQEVPGVEAAGITTNIAMSGFASPSLVSTTLEPPPPGQAAVIPSVIAVTPGYFEAMGTSLVRGRSFADTDRDNTLRVAVVDERLAARLWPGDDPVGKPLYRESTSPYTVVGVVRNVTFESLATQNDAVGTAYFPHAQAPPLPRLRWLAIKSAGDAGAVVRAARLVVKQIDPDLPLADIQTMAERTSQSLVSERLATRLAGIFGVVALLLSVLGIYAVLTHVVTGRRREIGIRIALGSSISGVFRLVLLEGMMFIAIGVLVGLAGAVAMGRLLQHQLFGVKPGDPVILGTGVLITASVGLLACIAPALRAASVDPAIALTDQ
jgi:predicted permease